ncbi:MAG: SDR family oxidoreductase [Burkholderiaceae bacterium]|jgi:UDP-glucuronate decarboxylase|nr:MAG: SDR family oxidoreductase [Burkholderiaceae bacterium]
MKRILVTGGAGFVGSHLCRELLAQSHQVICLDNLHSGRLSNIAALRDHPHFSFVQRDVIHPMDDLQVDEAYNLACPASPPHYQKDPIYTWKTCVLGALNVLELATRCGAKVLQASTSEVYGDPHVHPQPESYWGHVNPIGLRSCYDEGKRAAETLFFDFHRQHRTAIKVVRIFNTYGPHMAPDDGRVVSNFIVQALKGQPMTIYGDGSQTRSFCYVDDLVAGLMKTMATDASLTGPVNLGNPVEFTMLALAQQVTALTGSTAGIEFRRLPADDPKQRKPDITIAAQVLGWKPTVPLATGLAKTITYFQKQHD